MWNAFHDEIEQRKAHEPCSPSFKALILEAANVLAAVAREELATDGRRERRIIDEDMVSFVGFVFEERDFSFPNGIEISRSARFLSFLIATFLFCCCSPTELKTKKEGLKFKAMGMTSGAYLWCN